jgi:hypothetical protein
MNLIDATIGLDKFFEYQTNTYIERGERIKKGDYSMMWSCPGRAMR